MKVPRSSWLTSSVLLEFLGICMLSLTYLNLRTLGRIQFLRIGTHFDGVSAGVLFGFLLGGIGIVLLKKPGQNRTLTIALFALMFLISVLPALRPAG